jgi:hypothetical protein
MLKKPFARNDLLAALERLLCQAAGVFQLRRKPTGIASA